MKPAHSLLLTAAALALLAGHAHAQVYRVVGPDGRVTFSDKPLASASQGGQAAAPRSSGSAPASAAGGLPFELRQIAQRYPVTLYTGKDCEPCQQGRAMLTRRGIPFTEKTVNTPNDLRAFSKLTGGGNSLPLLTIGGQRLNGYASAEWEQYLDAAGYPKTSQLPRSYRQPAAAALAPVSLEPAAPAAAARNEDDDSYEDHRPAPAGPSIAPPPPTPDNPAGIRF